MAYQTIIVERKEHVGMLTLNRPQQLNTFNTQLAIELNDGLRELENDRRVRAVIIKGAGRAFCAGIDLHELSRKSALEMRHWVSLMDAHNVTIANMTKPVIAAVHGAAVANGCGLAAACDLTIASEDARFGTTAINVGLYCFGPSAPLSRCLGKKKSLELLLTGDIIDAKEAERIGLVNKVVAQEKLEETAMELAQKLAAKSPIALQMGKSSFYKMSDMAYEKALAYLGEVFTVLSTTEDAKEGIAAFLDKRQPEWKER
ncbi:MAG TPA: enoyl-CoA hydratase/isomerase family protein [Dehalococcoidia bacterium]|nr:enoyl-CoA hydratase/isomerase family protein [Dehalococcoidia bacterium]